MRHIYFFPDDRIWICAMRVESSLRSVDFLSGPACGPVVARRVRWHRRRAARYSKLAFAIAADHYGESYPRCPHEPAPVGAGAIVGRGGKTGQGA